MLLLAAAPLALILPLAFAARWLLQAAGTPIPPETLTLFAGVALSVVMAYTPGLRAKYDALSADYKRLVMLGLLLIVTAAIYLGACAGLGADLPLLTAVSCTRSGAVGMGTAFISALIANQATFLILPARPRNGE
ncbi:MAG: hypothetical protein IT318_24870 [Anaerolineales bacterium]|nr:hypothetical protein [Anaerolineales bacterium]